jgi:hypothetical protein
MSNNILNNCQIAEIIILSVLFVDYYLVCYKYLHLDELTSKLQQISIIKKWIDEHQLVPTLSNRIKQTEQPSQLQVIYIFSCSACAGGLERRLTRATSFRLRSGYAKFNSTSELSDLVLIDGAGFLGKNDYMNVMNKRQLFSEVQKPKTSCSIKYKLKNGNELFNRKNCNVEIIPLESKLH